MTVKGIPVAESKGNLGALTVGTGAVANWGSLTKMAVPRSRSRAPGSSISVSQGDQGLA
jgi:hypothetical protein